MVSVSNIEDSLKAKLKATHVELTDMSGGCGQIFEAVIVSDNFAGKTTLMRHRLVNSTLKEEISKLHAWTQKCYTPEEWNKRVSNGTVA